jgi:hypothetical protein
MENFLIKKIQGTLASGAFSVVQRLLAASSVQVPDKSTVTSKQVVK